MSDALEWLSDYLRPGGMRENKDMAVLLVTHDRYFLDKVCNEILELDRFACRNYYLFIFQYFMISLLFHFCSFFPL